MGWPASRNGVIAIQATDFLGKPFHNNTSRGESKERFATLGLNIHLGGYHVKGEKNESARSYATDTAVGIAANAIEFARYKVHLTEDRKRRLFSRSFVVNIFKKMMTRRGGCEYIQLWTLWEREDICDVLLEAISDC
ncbi:hypothetical protein F4810DRAFT_569816 [Camillea tinctor]|nr:hypothetical protein F4810DRAFT_569816 [Camillea tinctor]